VRINLVVSSLVALAVFLVLPAGSFGQQPTQDSVIGAGEGRLGSGAPFRFTVNISGDPSGRSPTGSVRWMYGRGAAGGVVSNRITCLAVHGNVAVFGMTGIYQSVVGIPVLGEYPVSTYVRVTDRSSGAPPGEGRDLVEHAAFLPGAPGLTNCAAFTPMVLSWTLDLEGDIVVTDAQSVPTSKDQCKKGGWHNYGTTFKNQGQCVSFFATGGEQRP
jgi:hypothetical protein